MVSRNSSMKVSVITACYNEKNCIELAIQTVLDQNYPDVEHIVIDGGSSDGTVDILRQYESELGFWLSEKDNGVYEALNKGIDAANGEIVFVLGADDVFCCASLQPVLRDVFIFGTLIRQNCNSDG